MSQSMSLRKSLNYTSTYLKFSIYPCDCKWCPGLASCALTVYSKYLGPIRSTKKGTLILLGSSQELVLSEYPCTEAKGLNLITTEAGHEGAVVLLPV